MIKNKLKLKWKEYAPTTSKRIILSLIIIYATFASTYNQIVTPSTPWKFTFPAFMFILMWLLFWIIASLSFFKLIEYIQKKYIIINKLEINKKNDDIKLWVQIFGIIFLGYLFWLIAYYPANMSYDSIVQWAQATGVEKINNAHPAIHTFLIRLCINIIKSPFIPVLVQTIIQCMIWATAGVYLYKKGLSKNIIFFMAIIVGINPINGIYTITLWKDIAFAIAVLGLTVSLAKITDKSNKINTIQIILFILAMVLTGMFRHNGIIITIILSILLFVFYFKSYLKIIAFVPLVIIIFINFIVYPLIIDNNSTRAVDSTNTMANGILVYAIGYVYYKDGKIDINDKELLEKNITVDIWKERFHPFSINPYFFNGNPTVMDATSHLNTSELLNIYIKSFIFNPFIIIGHHLNISDVAWSVFQSKDPLSYTYYFHTETHPEYSDLRKNKNMTGIANKIINKYGDSIFLTIFSRSGIYIILLLLLGYYALLKNKFYINIISVPVLGNTLSLLMFNLAPDYRYTYAAMFTFPFIFRYFLIITKNKNEINKENNNV